ncbi:pyruvate ferredoxin oxidoreductase [Candidatus Woesearchaeota archaeon]|nr:pyruvate ferredoxin oxidoreductase [Candidatus Woesearchaeota archaeon]
MTSKINAMTGAEATAEAMRQVNPDVVPAYPITPQTPVMHAFASFVSDGLVDSELIRVESEHSAMSAAVGASAAGSRVMTATSANGLALMFEIVYIASSTRLPIVMNVVNRALSGPINIHCDHSDSMACRDSGWIQIYCENAQEVYETSLFAVRLAEHCDILLPVMICQDGFIISHSVERVETFDDESVRSFIGEYRPKHCLLDTDNPITIGPLDLFDYYYEHKRQQAEAINNAREIIPKLAAEYKGHFGKDLNFLESYKMDDATDVIVVMSSTAGTTKAVVDKLRAEGKKVGLLKPRLFRPFPAHEISLALKGKRMVAVLDRSDSFGSMGGPLFSEIRSALYDEAEKPIIINYIYGLGGREMMLDDIEGIYNEISCINSQPEEKVKYFGVRE